MTISTLKDIFAKSRYKFNIYSDVNNLIEFKDKIFEKKQSINANNYIELFITLDQKLINFDFNKYSMLYIKKNKNLFYKKKLKIHLN